MTTFAPPVLSPPLICHEWYTSIELVEGGKEVGLPCTRKESTPDALMWTGGRAAACTCIYLKPLAMYAMRKACAKQGNFFL